METKYDIYNTLGPLQIDIVKKTISKDNVETQEMTIDGEKVKTSDIYTLIGLFIDELDRRNELDIRSIIGYIGY